MMRPGELSAAIAAIAPGALDGAHMLDATLGLAGSANRGGAATAAAALLIARHQ